MKHSKTSKTNRRSFLKLLGLGGTAAATGLVAGVKVLGGTVAPTESLPLATKTIKHEAMRGSVAELWAREALKQFEEQLPIKRDFAALPGPAVDKVNVNRPPSHSRYRSGEPCIAVFKKEGMESVVQFGEASFQYTKSCDMHLDDSALFGTTVRQGDELPMECTLEGSCDWIKGMNPRDVLMSNGPFDLEIVQGDRKMTLTECYVDSMAWTMVAGLFEVDFRSVGEHTTTWIE